jgi:hypothetical protein
MGNDRVPDPVSPRCGLNVQGTCAARGFKAGITGQQHLNLDQPDVLQQRRAAWTGRHSVGVVGDSSEPLAFRRKTPQQTQIPNKACPSRAGTRHP